MIAIKCSSLYCFYFLTIKKREESKPSCVVLFHSRQYQGYVAEQQNKALRLDRKIKKYQIGT